MGLSPTTRSYIKKKKNYERIGGTRTLRTRYEEFVKEKGFNYEEVNSVSPYNDTTLFCPSGMQKYGEDFRNKSIVDKTVCNIQPCIRLNDLDEIGDGTHLLYFNMMGMFSFRDLTLKETINFWVEFIEQKLGLTLDYITIHPDKKEWSKHYTNKEIVLDDECIWSDGGENSGYCTEFYIDGVEIGNIVNTNGDCIDVGFGYDRIEQILFNLEPKTEIKVLEESIEKIIQSGYEPSNKKQGYVLRKLLRILVKKGGYLDNKFFHNEKERQLKLLEKYRKLKNKHKDKSKEWWFDTHGIDLEYIVETPRTDEMK